MSSPKSVDTIRLELEKIAFRKLRRAGIAILPSQIKLSLTVKQQVFTNQITLDDWDRLLELGVSTEGKDVLERLRLFANQPLNLYDFFGDYQAINTFKNHVRSYAAPLYIATINGKVCIKKRMLKK